LQYIETEDNILLQTCTLTSGSRLKQKKKKHDQEDLQVLSLALSILKPSFYMTKPKQQAGESYLEPAVIYEHWFAGYRIVHMKPVDSCTENCHRCAYEPVTKKKG
jgi:hypothetical protein